MHRIASVSAFVILSLTLSACSFEASKAAGPGSGPEPIGITSEPKRAPAGPTIEIKPNSPSDTVRAFYERLRQRKFREAIHLTNLRPAIEGLTDDELREFAVDFEAIARLVPEQIQINGEIISGDDATVTANLPSDNDDGVELQELRLRREGEYWVILSADEEAEKRIKKEGKNYFYVLKIETHQEEAKKMLERIAKAQLAYSLQNKGIYTEIAKLVEIGYLPQDITTGDSTGYLYAVKLASDRKSYFATATPAKYGKTGRNSYLLELDENGPPRVSGRDNAGEPLKK